MSLVDDAITAPGNYGFGLATFTQLPGNAIGASLTNFTVSQVARFALSTYLANLFNGSAEVVMANYITTSSDAVQAIWNGTLDLDRWIQNLATSMSNIVRTDIPLARDVFNGSAYTLAYVVRWNWLILPTILVLLSFLLWIAITIQTARSPVEAWKDSPLTLLLSDVDEEIKQSVDGQMDKYRGIERAIGKKSMVLAGEPGGIRKFQVDSATRRRK